MRRFHNDSVRRLGWKPLEGCNCRARYIYNPDANVYILESFYTHILMYNPETLSVKRLWSDYSRTSMKHVRAFCNALNIHATIDSKHAWESLPVGEWVRL